MLKSISSRLQSRISNLRIARLARAVAKRENQPPDARPVVFFNASARLGHLSQNAAFSLLAAWGLRQSGVRILHFVCERGMSRCVLGTNPDIPSQSPPCSACVAQSRRLYAGAEVAWFGYAEDASLAAALESLALPDLEHFAYNGMPLGELVLPGLRWALRRHHLVDDEPTRFLYKQYILSAFNVAVRFQHLLDEQDPQAVVLFNGLMYPEAVARWLAQRRGLRTITHEVALLPLSAFFTEGQATAYPLNIPANFELTTERSAQLDSYLQARFQGQFSMAGIQFWPHMQELDADFLAKAARYKKIVPVFTNVVFDTSQIHANTLFPHMFAWLDAILSLIKAQADTLFILRAHPDEFRPGTRKQSRESVRAWVRASGAHQLPNVIFVDADEYLSSYALIRRAHFVMVYNSSIGLEASILNKPVLCAGAARYTSYPTVFYPASAAAYIQQAKEFLAAAHVDQPDAFVAAARRVLYFQLFRTALPFQDYLQAHTRLGYVHLRSFPPEALLPNNSPAIRTIRGGVVSGEPFLV